MALHACGCAGPSAVVVTRGGDGLTVHSRAGAEHSVPGEKIDVVDTIGAGDTVNAALLHGLSTRAALPTRPSRPWAPTTGPACSASPPARRRSPAPGRARSRPTRQRWAKPRRTHAAAS